MTARPLAPAQLGVRGGRKSVLDAPTRLSEPLNRRTTVVPDRSFRSSARKRLLGRVVLYGGTFAVVAILVQRLPLAGSAPVPSGPGGQAMADTASLMLRDPLLLLALGMMIGLAHLGKWLVERAAADPVEAGETRTDIGRPPRPVAGSWSARVAAGMVWWRAAVAEVEAVKAMVRREGVWAWRRKLVPYLTAFVTYFSVLLTLMTLSKSGFESTFGISARVGMILPTIFLGLVLSGVLLPAILALDRLAERAGIARGASDVAIGVMLNCVFLYPIVSHLREGRLPDVQMLLSATTFLIAGAVAGLVFWRGEGYPVREHARPGRVDPAGRSDVRQWR